MAPYTVSTELTWFIFWVISVIAQIKWLSEYDHISYTFDDIIIIYFIVKVHQKQSSFPKTFGNMAFHEFLAKVWAVEIAYFCCFTGFEKP